MTEIMIKVVGAHAVTVRKDGRLTTGMVGAVARFSFDGVWKDLVKVAVFRGSGVTRDVLEFDGDAVRIPAEVLAAEGRLFVGVEGRNTDGSVVIPTVWVECGVVVCGANASGDVSTDPGLAVWAQIQSQIGPLEELQTKDKASLVAAINEALRSGGGSVDEDAVERIVEAYLAEHPPEGGTVDPEAVGQIVEEYLQEHPVETDKELLVEGVPADAYVTGQNIRNIGTAVNALERVSRYMTDSAWALKIDSVAKTVTVPSGMLACADWCTPLPEQTVAIVQDDATTLVVYDSSADAVRSVRFQDYTGKTMYVIAAITRDRYAEPNANYVQGSYMVDGVLVGGRETGDYIQTPSTAQVGQTIVVKEVDESGKPVSWECVDVAGGAKLLVDHITEQEIFTPGIPDTTFSEDLRGNSFSFKNVMVRVSGTFVNDVDTDTFLRIWLNGSRTISIQIMPTGSNIDSTVYAIISADNASRCSAITVGKTINAQTVPMSIDNITEIRMTGNNYNKVHLAAGASIKIWGWD